MHRDHCFVIFLVIAFAGEKSFHLAPFIDHMLTCVSWFGRAHPTQHSCTFGVSSSSSATYRAQADPRARNGTSAALLVPLESIAQCARKTQFHRILTNRTFHRMSQSRLALHLLLPDRHPLALARLRGPLPPTDTFDHIILLPASRNSRILRQHNLKQLCERPEVAQSYPTIDHALHVFKGGCKLSEGECRG